jgi:hypothetical protein
LEVTRFTVGHLLDKLRNDIPCEFPARWRSGFRQKAAIQEFAALPGRRTDEKRWRKNHAVPPRNPNRSGQPAGL